MKTLSATLMLLEEFQMIDNLTMTHPGMVFILFGIFGGLLLVARAMEVGK